MKILCSILGVIIVSGCTTQQSKISYTEPQDYSTPEYSEISFNRSKNDIWDTIITNLSKSQLKIDKIDKASNYISLKLHSDPDQYIDCGSRQITHDKYSTQIKNASSHYKYSKFRRNHLDTYNMKNDLTSEANIIIRGNNSTSKANVQVVFTLNVLEKRTTTQGYRYAATKDYVLILAPNETKFFDVFGTNCRSKGTFEKEIRSLLTKKIARKKGLDQF